MTSVQSMAFEVGALPGFNGALAFGVSNTGYVVGSSMLNQGSGLPFIWSDQGGMVAVPLATGTSEGSARAVNSAGWVVGNDSSAFSIPFLYDGTNTYRLADLIPPNSGWDLSMNTSSSADGISEDGVIVGTGVHNGETHAYAMVPVAPSPRRRRVPHQLHTTATATLRDTNSNGYAHGHILRHRRQELLLHQGRARIRDRDRNWNCRGRRVACVISP